jgi:hypothetical protein
LFPLAFLVSSSPVLYHFFNQWATAVSQKPDVPDVLSRKGVAMKWIFKILRTSWKISTHLALLLLMLMRFPEELQELQLC